MRVKITKDEYYPFFDIEDVSKADEERRLDPIVELDKEFVNKFKKALREFRNLQEILKKIS